MTVLVECIANIPTETISSLSRGWGGFLGVPLLGYRKNDQNTIKRVIWLPDIHGSLFRVDMVCKPTVDVLAHPFDPCAWHSYPPSQLRVELRMIMFVTPFICFQTGKGFHTHMYIWTTVFQFEQNHLERKWRVVRILLINRIVNELDRPRLGDMMYGIPLAKSG